MNEETKQMLNRGQKPEDRKCRTKTGSRLKVEGITGRTLDGTSREPRAKSQAESKGTSREAEARATPQSNEGTRRAKATKACDGQQKHESKTKVKAENEGKSW